MRLQNQELLLMGALGKIQMLTKNSLVGNYSKNLTSWSGKLCILTSGNTIDQKVLTIILDIMVHTSDSFPKFPCPCFFFAVFFFLGNNTCTQEEAALLCSDSTPFFQEYQTLFHNMRLHEEVLDIIRRPIDVSPTVGPSGEVKLLSGSLWCRV